MKGELLWRGDLLVARDPGGLAGGTARPPGLAQVT